MLRLPFKLRPQAVMSTNPVTLDPNNKDGNAINVAKCSSRLTSISVCDLHCVENAKLKVEKFLQELSDIKEIIEATRSSLFNDKMSVKSWKVNELVFYDKQLEVIKKVSSN